MKIRITILAILLILLIIVPIVKMPEAKRNLRIEFEIFAITGFRKASLEDFIFYLTNDLLEPQVKYNWEFENRMPTWQKLHC